MPLAGGSGQVPLSTEPTQGNVRVFYPLVSLKFHPQGCQGAGGENQGSPRSLFALKRHIQVKSRKNPSPCEANPAHLCSADAADRILQGSCNSWHRLRVQPSLPACSPRREIKGSGRGWGIPAAECTWQPCQGGFDGLIKPARNPSPAPAAGIKALALLSWVWVEQLGWSWLPAHSPVLCGQRFHWCKV